MNKTESVKVTDLQGTVDPSLTSVGLQILKSVMTKRFLCQLCYVRVLIVKKYVKYLESDYRIWAVSALICFCDFGHCSHQTLSLPA